MDLLSLSLLKISSNYEYTQSTIIVPAPILVTNDSPIPSAKDRSLNGAKVIGCHALDTQTKGLGLE